MNSDSYRPNPCYRLIFRRREQGRARNIATIKIQIKFTVNLQYPRRRNRNEMSVLIHSTIQSIINPSDFAIFAHKGALILHIKIRGSGYSAQTVTLEQNGPRENVPCYDGQSMHPNTVRIQNDTSTNHEASCTRKLHPQKPEHHQAQRRLTER